MQPSFLPVRHVASPSLPEITTTPFHTFAEIPPEIEWFANRHRTDTRPAAAVSYPAARPQVTNLTAKSGAM